ncbi:MAG: Acetylornithine and succinylornithine aminotransferase [uncultured bacterium]|nr:MAG: Acetylornithine and succinylornithine aminotransferase [uncultured bacterium]
MKKVESAGSFLLKELNKLKAKYGLVKEVRGRGLMVGCELHQPIGTQIVLKCLEKGLVINCLHDNVLRFVPPLIINQKEMKEALKILESVFEGLNNVS